MEREKSSWIPVSGWSWAQAQRTQSCCDTGLLARHGATQTLPDGPCGSVPVLTALPCSPALWNLQLSSEPWTPQLIPGTVSADPPLQALEVVVLWVPHGTAPQSLHRFSSAGPWRSPGALGLCSADGSSQWLCAVALFVQQSVPRQSLQVIWSNCVNNLLGASFLQPEVCPEASL